MKSQHTPLPALLAQIELYFDCKLSDEQERALIAEIARTPFSHPAIHPACAVMGIRRPACLPKRQSIVRRALPKAGIAASLALAITLAVLLLRPSEPSRCVAFANGKMITDEDAVMSLIAQNTSEFSEDLRIAEQSMIDDIMSIAPIVDVYESEFNPF